MSPKYEEDLSSALGAICEVLTRENHLLFVGRIQEYDRAGGRLCAELRKGEGTPGGVLYHEPVKVHIYMGQEQGKVMIAYGQVERIDAGKGWYSYGCSFYDLRPGQEDQLCRDIFNLQARSINRKS